jgi:hypothetical protein
MTPCEKLLYDTGPVGDWHYLGVFAGGILLGFGMGLLFGMIARLKR